MYGKKMAGIGGMLLLCGIMTLSVSGEERSSEYFGLSLNECTEECREEIEGYIESALEKLKEDKAELEEQSGSEWYEEILHTIIYLLPDEIEDEQRKEFFGETKAIVHFTVLSDFPYGCAYSSYPSMGYYRIDREGNVESPHTDMLVQLAKRTADRQLLPADTEVINLRGSYNGVLE